MNMQKKPDSKKLRREEEDCLRMRNDRLFSGKGNHQQSYLHSARESVSGSQERLKDLQKISRQMVESLTKALTPNRRVRQTSQNKQEEAQTEPKQRTNRLVSNHEDLCNVRTQEQSKENQSKDTYINFRKFARKIAQEPVHNVRVIRAGKKMTRQRSQDFNSKQEQWLKQKNDKLLKKRLEKQLSDQASQNLRRMSTTEKFQTDRRVF